MNNKTTEVKLWKVSIGTKLNVEKVESVLKEALGMLQEMAHEDTIMELQRIDVKEGETVVFISGKEATVNTFMRTLKMRSLKARSEVSEARASDLHKLP